MGLIAANKISSPLHYLYGLMLVLCSTALFAEQTTASPIQFMTHNVEGKTYIDENGQMRGKPNTGRRAFNLELVREMMLKIGHPVGFTVVPFKRGFDFVENHANYALFNVTRNPSRELLVKWVGPLQEDVTRFIEMKDAPSGIQTLEDAKAVPSICVLNGGVYDEFLTKKGFTNLVGANTYAQCFKMLAMQRVSLTPSSLYALPERLKVVDLAAADVTVTPVEVFKTSGYLSFSRNIPDHTIQQWQDALDEIKTSGRYNQLVREYLIVE